MWKVAVILALSTTILSASVFHCPEGTICSESGVIESTSFQFLDKLGPKQYQTITKLTVLNASLDKVPAELKYLKKLEYLDLSDNNIQVSSIPALPHLKTLKLSRNSIKGISLTLLPRNIEDLDLSNNLLTQIPKDWSSLVALKTLHLHKNLIDCDCYSNNILTYGRLIKNGINIPEPVICFVPKHFAGKNINSVNCTAEDEMINDQPEEGSGASPDIFSEEKQSAPQYFQEQEEVEENEVIDDRDELPQEQPFVPANDISSSIAPEEGSGDLEGSGFAPIEIGHIPACVLDNCATPEPIGVHDSKNDTGSAPGPTDQIKIIAEDVFHPIFAEPTSSTSTTTTTTTEAPSSTTSIPKEVNEEIISKVSHPGVYKEYQPTGDVDVFANETRTAEMEKATAATALNQNNYAVYVVVICGLLLAVVFLVCLIKKRKEKRLNKNRREFPSGLGEEMKPLEKPALHAVNEKNGKTSNSIPEHIPLINGQNGKPRDDPILKSFTPLEHPELNLDNSQDTDVDEPIIREKSELLTPITERVTIRASEIPESIPKTPVLVHRQKNSEGEIVTTVVPP